MQHATTVVSYVSGSSFLVPRVGGVRSLQIVLDWLACLMNYPSKNTILSDSKKVGLSCLEELSQ